MNCIDLRGHVISISLHSNPRAEVKLEFHFGIPKTLLYLFIFNFLYFIFFLLAQQHLSIWNLHVCTVAYTTKPMFPVGQPDWAVPSVPAFCAYPTLNNCLYVPFIVTSETRSRIQWFALERINLFVALILTPILFPTCRRKAIQIFPSQDNVFNSFCVFPIFGCFCINRLI